ncbi:MAG TPA: helix-turn-helix domain-containing protein [Puia sp.]|nr:helix-turn-helix domain-containing protein [Puia sp.]
MREISFCKMVDFESMYITPTIDLPDRDLERADKNVERHFSVYRRSEQACNIEIGANKSEFYKILLMTRGSGEFDYGVNCYQVVPNSLIFVKPSEVRACRETTEEQDGYYCTFTEQFYSSDIALLRELKLSALFAPGTHPVINLTDDETDTMIQIFNKIHIEFNSWNNYSAEIIRLYLRVLLIESTRIFSGQLSNNPKRAANYELTQRFHELLEVQFAFVPNGEFLRYKSASQFANMLSVHPNHLNASIKQITGKSVSEVIKNRILIESQVLLKYTDKQISEISHLLAFKELSSFTHFFRKETGISPSNYRDSLL